ncbi:MAG: DUF620 domain-containing protein [Planctomycetota bacterium]
MTKRLLIRTLAIAVAITFTAQAGSMLHAQDDLPSAQDVITKYVEATGGLEAYQAMTSLKMTGTLTVVGQGVEGEMTMMQVHPDKAMMKIELAGLGSEGAGTNGEHAWSMSMMMGNRLLEGAEADEIKLQSDFRRMYDPASIYDEITCTGMEAVDGDECYILELVRSGGTTSKDYYSKTSGLLVQSVTTSTTPMGEMQIITMPSEYKEVGGVMMPHMMVQDMGPAKVEIVFDSIEVNGEIDEATFAPPEAIQNLIDKAEAEGAETESAEAAAGDGG